MWQQMRKLMAPVLGRPAAGSGRTRPAPRRFRPGVENLETRWCPSTTVGISNGNTLVVRGDDAANELGILQNDEANTLTVSADGQTRVFDSQQVTRIDVELRGGDDVFGWVLQGDYFHAKEASVVLGAGADWAEVNFGYRFVSRLYANLLLTVNGGAGDDYVFAGFNGKDTG